MPVLINGRPKPARGGRGKAFDREIRECAHMLLSAQAEGHIDSRAIADALNRQGLKTLRGSDWSDAVVYRMLKRGREIGIPFIRHGRSEAASKRKVHRRSKFEIEAARRQAFAKIASVVANGNDRADQSDAATISPSLSPCCGGGGEHGPTRPLS